MVPESSPADTVRQPSSTQAAVLETSVFWLPEFAALENVTLITFEVVVSVVTSTVTLGITLFGNASKDSLMEIAEQVEASCIQVEYVSPL